MKTITITTCPGFEEWRRHARDALHQGLSPDQILWCGIDTREQDLFTAPAQSVNRAPRTQPSQKDPTVLNAHAACATQAGTTPFAVSKNFLEGVQLAACHAAPDRFALLYRILWRLRHENKNLLHHKTDNDILKLHAYIKAVRRDAYKIKAFLRFREAPATQAAPLQDEHFIAWYEPEHYTLELTLPFFQTRFKNMSWSILTPYRAAHWDRTTLTLQDNPDPASAPQDDNIERYWLTYYATTFNPARPKKAAMLTQMPKKYWKNMPETVLIPDLLRQSETRARKMIADGHNKNPKSNSAGS